MSPTTMLELPPLIARACGAWIWTMSHCRPLRLSLPGAGVPASTGAASSDEAVSSESWVAKRADATAPLTRRSALTLEANVAWSDDAMTTPMAP
jgi:hypothetical protein